MSSRISDAIYSEIPSTSKSLKFSIRNSYDNCFKIALSIFYYSLAEIALVICLRIFFRKFLQEYFWWISNFFFNFTTESSEIPPIVFLEIPLEISIGIHATIFPETSQEILARFSSHDYTISVVFLEILLHFSEIILPFIEKLSFLRYFLPIF